MIDILHLPPDQLASLRAEDVQLYLVGHGWKRDDASSDPQGSVYRYPAISDAEALLPGRRDLADYVERMADVVQILAAVEERNALQVLADLSMPPADVLRLQITARDATLSTLPLEEGIRLIQGARAACCLRRRVAPVRPPRFTPGKPTRKRSNFSSRVTLARPSGGVLNLKADPSLFDDFEGTVTRKADVGGTPTRVQVLLNRLCSPTASLYSPLSAVL